MSATVAVLPKSRMLSSVLLKTIRERWLVTVMVAAGLVFYAGFALGIYSSFGGQAVDMINSLPEGLKALYGSNDGTAAGMVVGATFSILAPIVILAYAISGGNSAAIGEERQGSLDLLLSAPISRTRVLLSKFAVLVAGILAISLLTWIGMELVGPVVGMDLGNQDILALSIQLAGLGIMFAAFTTAIGAWTGSGLGAAIAGALAGISYLVTNMFPIDPNLADYAKFTPWYLYTGGEPLLNGVDWVSLIAMLVISAALVVVAIFGLQRRDLRG